MEWNGEYMENLADTATPWAPGTGDTGNTGTAASETIHGDRDKVPVSARITGGHVGLVEQCTLC